ncbi:YopX family protein [Bacillus pumilus]|uniref:YopX family protein n=1 Tax=Bacillus pumilus TaxID=1408 RepID=UPI003F42BCC1
MREIKFRAFEEHSQRMFYNVQSGIYMDPDEFESFNDILGLARYKVMQFTGLKDKNGDEIYEGDTVRLRNESGFTSLGEVQFSDGCFEVKFQCGLAVFNGARHQYTKYRDYVKVFASNHAIEVVGNIYQNPDLLEEAQ